MDTQIYIAQLEREVREADARISSLELSSLDERIETKLHTYREIGMIRRRREEAARKLNELRADTAQKPEVVA